jgi:hypothetical protein
MAFLGGALVLLAPILLAVGLIFPRLFSKKGTEKPSRWRGAGIGVVLLVAGVTLIIAFPDDRMQEIAEKPKPQPTTGSTEAVATKPEATVTATEPGADPESVKPATVDNTGGQAALSLPEPAQAKPPAMKVTDYLANCHKAEDTTFAADCLGKPVEGVLYFGSPSAEETKQMMSIPGNYEDILWVTFATVPDWGAKEPVRWTGRRETIMAKVAARSEDGGANFDNAEIVRNDAWRDRAAQMIKEREGVLEAMWPHETVALWVVMRNNGRKRDNEARQFCTEVWRAGRPENEGVVITILDATRLLQDDRVEIGKAYCR